MSIRLQEATTEDAPVIAEMASRIWQVHYTPIIGSAQVEYMLNKGYSTSALVNSMKNGERFFLCKDGQKNSGYVSVTQKGEGEYFLNKFYLEIAEQGKGAGTKAFELLLEELPDLQLMRLQVNRLNYKTINFYFKLGFTIEYAKDFDIGEGYSMDDYVMIRRKR